jgi:glycerophosphoryl diester phosphodiesterase
VTRSLAWLTSRPLAHRGLHDAAAGVIENTASAFRAAVEAGYGIECDVQLSRDGEAMVHHDETLWRLMERPERVADLEAAELKQIPYRAGADRMLALADLCELVGGRVPLVVEIKCRFDGDMQLTRRVIERLTKYKGPAAAMSFDPAIVGYIRQHAPALPRGIVAERHYDDEGWKLLSRPQKLAMAFLLHAPFSRPQFVAYRVGDLPSPVAAITKTIFRLPLLTWTVWTPEERRTAAHYADQMIFEGFRPAA